MTIENIKAILKEKFDDKARNVELCPNCGVDCYCSECEEEVNIIIEKKRNYILGRLDQINEEIEFLEKIHGNNKLVKEKENVFYWNDKLAIKLSKEIKELTEAKIYLEGELK